LTDADTDADQAHDISRDHHPRQVETAQCAMLTSELNHWPGKHRSAVTTMARAYQAIIITPHGPRVCFQASTEGAGGGS
jgi:hypothetical protein